MYILFSKKINFVNERICTHIINIIYFFIGSKYISLHSSCKKNIFVCRNLFENFIYYEILMFEETCLLDKKIV